MKNCQKLCVYRGASVGRNLRGLSWTRNLEKAVWFSNRFNTEGKHGYVQTAIVPKNEIFAYFNTRGEEEIVCSVKQSDVTIVDF